MQRIDNARRDEEGDGKLEKKEAENEATCNDWRAVLTRLNDQVKQVVKLPDVVEVVETITKDYVDIKIQYKRIKIEEQCRKLNPKVNIPRRSSWRDRINGNMAATNVEPMTLAI